MIDIILSPECSGWRIPSW